MNPTTLKMIATVAGGVLAAVGATEWPPLGGWELVASKACFGAGVALNTWVHARRPGDVKAAP